MIDTDVVPLVLESVGPGSGACGNPKGPLNDFFCLAGSGPAPRPRHVSCCAKKPKCFSADVERELAIRIQAGDLAARDELVTGNLNLVRHFASKLTKSARHDLAFEDLVQSGIEGLLIAVDRFDHTRAFRFSTYAAFWIKQRIRLAILGMGSPIRLPIYIHERGLAPERAVRVRHVDCARLSQLPPSPLESLVEAEDFARARSALARLRPDQIDLLRWFTTEPESPNSRRSAWRLGRIAAAKTLLAELRGKLDPQEGTDNA